MDIVQKEVQPVPKAVEAILKEFADVMLKELPKTLPPRREMDHVIELEPGAKPPAKAPYRMAPPELKELRKQLMTRPTPNFLGIRDGPRLITDINLMPGPLSKD
ncbi:unnamed protein product [Prunus armeniaca]